jgi:hypothetical protein
MKHFAWLPFALFAAPIAAADSAAAFESLKHLVGTWQPADKPDSPMRVQFELLAGDSVLAETWRSPTHRSMTVYHLDGDTLIATHYCPQGNQPRLALVSDRDGELRFELRDGSNLDVPGGHHEHVLTLRRDGEQLVRGEAYAENARPFDAAAAALEATRFRRVATQAEAGAIR